MQGERADKTHESPHDPLESDFILKQGRRYFRSISPPRVSTRNLSLVGCCHHEGGAESADYLLSHPPPKEICLTRSRAGPSVASPWN
ncbi:hypothetical protein NPIL_490881 [Nephila pilipes]|uniref:Uncharacterized protein n=1 Tax=Nephila pilipes TaxID=299642 RepID=A0A8X6PYR2_NEPPI|nr:hypothetical protein NPIL_490881 [Nephila pilipes]